jgi:hypothetical protein
VLAQIVINLAALEIRVEQFHIEGARPGLGFWPTWNLGLGGWTLFYVAGCTGARLVSSWSTWELSELLDLVQ